MDSKKKLEEKIQLTSNDVSAAFHLLSQEGRFINSNDIKLFLTKYFPNLPSKAEKILVGTSTSSSSSSSIHSKLKLKELQSIIKNKGTLNQIGYHELTKILEPTFSSDFSGHGCIMSKTTLNSLIDKFNETMEIALPSDYTYVLNKIDLDKDERISIQDWKHMEYRIFTS